MSLEESKIIDGVTVHLVKAQQTTEASSSPASTESSTTATGAAAAGLGGMPFGGMPGGNFAMQGGMGGMPDPAQIS